MTHVQTNIIHLNEVDEDRRARLRRKRREQHWPTLSSRRNGLERGLTDLHAFGLARLSEEVLGGEETVLILTENDLELIGVYAP